MHRPPKFLFVQVNQRCNLRCGHCDFWTRDDHDKPNYLSAARQVEILQEFSELSAGGAVVICGGEPMLDIDDYFAITRQCLKLGLRSLSVVNGTRIRGAALADKTIIEGPDEIAISLNAHHAELHDRTRGVPGAFNKAVAALRLLVAARERHPERGTRINVMGLVFDENYRDLDAFYDFVLNDIKADKLKLNFLQPSFGHDAPSGDDFFAEHARLDPEELGAIIQRCDQKYKLGLNPVWHGQVKMYFRSLEGANDLDRSWSSQFRTGEHICNTYDRNIMVDHYGMARLCFATEFRGMQIEKYGDLRQFWETSDDIRAQMHQCNRACGISHSVRRETSTVASRGATVDLSPPTSGGWISALRRRISAI
jgi:MoaA/NifB/PqqE/SkfB family radical SAM enzyme